MCRSCQFVCSCMCAYTTMTTFLAKGSLQIFFCFVLFFQKQKLAKMHSNNFKGVECSWSCSQFKSVWLPVRKLCNLHLWAHVMEPRAQDGGMGRQWELTEFWGAWWSTKPSVHCDTSKPPLYRHHLSPWEWHMCDNVTSHTMPSRQQQQDRQIIHG